MPHYCEFLRCELRSLRANLIYFSFQSVQLLSPLQTSLSFLPLAMSGMTVSFNKEYFVQQLTILVQLNILSGLLMNRVRPQILILIGLVLSVVSIPAYTFALDTI